MRRAADARIISADQRFNQQIPLLLRQTFYFQQKLSQIFFQIRDEHRGRRDDVAMQNISVLIQLLFMIQDAPRRFHDGNAASGIRFKFHF